MGFMEETLVPMIVANNLNALASKRWLQTNDSNMAKSLERLSSGYKINSGKDDPSGLVISEQLRAQENGMQRALQNTQEANNMMGIAEGALNEMNNMLVRIRQLALHASNNTTNPIQIGADQAEVDSTIQTMDRNARNTRYSFDQFLLNGNKQLQYSSKVEIKDSLDANMLDHGMTQINQIFKRDDYVVSINFSGSSTDADGNIIESGSEAQKGFFEISKAQNGATQLNTGYTGDEKGKNYTLSAVQGFTLKGNGGSRYMTFAKGTHLGEMATTINSASGSTGVVASLIFDSDSDVVDLANGSQQISLTATHTSGAAEVYNRTSLGEITTSGVTNINVSDYTKVQTLGKNIDGYGRVYLKMLDDDTYAIYKDQALSMQIAEGDLTLNTSGTYDTTIISSNNSGFSGIDMTFGGAVSAGMTSVIQLGVFHEDTVTSGSNQFVDTIDMSDFTNDTKLGTNASFFNSSGSFLSGVNLGVNTSDTGKLYIKADLNAIGSSSISIYNDSRMRDEDMMATSGDTELGTGGGAVRLYATRVDSMGNDTGLYGTLNFNSIIQDLDIDGSVIEFTNLGLRISAQEYGTNEFVGIDAREGALWSRYTDTGDAVLMDSGLTGVSFTEYGRDATIAINGQQVSLDGIDGDVATLDISAHLGFKEGELGVTTIAAVGYDVGAFATKAGTLNDSNTATNENAYVTHALHSTTEILSDWTGGMQLQLGDGDGDQERSVISMRDMTALSLGRVAFFDRWSDDSTLKSNKVLSLSDILSGGVACLSNDPTKCLQIIDKAIEDVSNMRAGIGAYQANLLTTNSNNLSVAIENITKTESYIRDADMAYESTEFSKNQIMVQASTSMLAQANANQQQVLSLIG